MECPRCVIFWNPGCCPQCEKEVAHPGSGECENCGKQWTPGYCPKCGSRERIKEYRFEDFIEGEPDLHPFGSVLGPVLEAMRYLSRDQGGQVSHVEASDFFRTWGITNPQEQHMWRYYFSVVTQETAAASEEMLAGGQPEGD